MEMLAAMQQVLTHPITQSSDTRDAAARLARCAAIERSLAQTLSDGLARVSDRLLRVEMSRHREQDERHEDLLQARARERNEAGPGGAGPNDPDLLHWLGQMACAKDDVELLAGIYGVGKPILADAYRDLIAADPEGDRFPIDLLRDLLIEEEAQIEWGLAQMRRVAAGAAARERADDWAEYLRLTLRAAGDVWGDMPRRSPPRRPGFSDRRP
jgi:hypothetical protein